MPTPGVTGALPYDPVQYCVLAACTAVAWCFTLELDLTIILTFHRRSGIYFWSFLICSWGCALHALGFILKFLVGTSWLVNLTFIEIGWVAMVSGQSFVLWSRLNLVVRNQKLRWLVLAAIIIDGLCLHTPTLVFIYGANSPSWSRWVDKFNAMERVQLMGFCIQESVISGIYIVATVKLLSAVYYMRTRNAMIQLLAVNFVCIAMDMILIGLEFSNNYVAEASVKPLVYAIKLKLEFIVYCQLVGFTKATFEDRERERLSSVNQDEQINQREYNSPADFFKTIPNVLKKPTVPTHPTVHTHPEQLLKGSDRFDFAPHWDSSQVELSPKVLAAARSASGGEGSIATPRKAKALMGNPPADSGPRMVNRAKNREAQERKELSLAASENGATGWAKQ
ncbi:MAG: hypothetical protein Q9191_007409, partial [Dirinaria sp. TL-2023a]